MFIRGPSNIKIKDFFGLCRFFESLLEFGHRAGEGVEAVRLLTLTACHYLYFSSSWDLGAFFIHTVKYIRTVLHLCIYTWLYFCFC